MADDDPVQPDEGQGGTSPYQEYLDKITDDEARGVAEEAFKSWDANQTRRFQEAAEYKKQWEPLEQLGVNQRDPAEVEWAMQVADLASSDPAEFQKWVNSIYASQHGLTPEQEQTLEEYVDPSIQRLEQELGTVAQQLAAQEEWRQRQEVAAAESQFQAQMEGRLEELRAEHPDMFNEDLFDKFIPAHTQEALESNDGRVAVEKAFEDMQHFIAQVEKGALQAKANTPQGAESGGVPDGTPDKIDTMEKARAVARQMLRNSRNA